MSIHPRGLDFLRDVDVRLTVELGRTQMKLKDVLSLGPESLVVLDRLTDELLDVLVNGKPIARGEVVSHNGRFGLRIVEIAGLEGAEGGSAEDALSPALPDGEEGAA
ncbi:flagellar motor switch protein FliN/FliY [Novosphingobium sp. PhB57]|jgi:flagellar motor switch protein FliN/FliY|uniref:flagellar motor switch protein FliN n=1 Tax=unclassified Novosphingobium TaxID=2644732 RepID=UPI0010468D7F|nr:MULTISPECIES: flagellar motor switch protein FliN [unclassified Novosphingobium]TCU55917.1 flagellar motor switch protein FliN/FliY [Novosphingobium sp. PhB57]TDW65055.1 flagellar motor switch protein FliN/FliY [Novosphingobium sp. PhB55]